VEPSALEAHLRNGTGSLTGKTFLGHVLGAEVERDPFGITHETRGPGGTPIHLRLLLPDPQAGEAVRLVKAARVASKGKSAALPPCAGFGAVDGLPYMELAPPRGTWLTVQLGRGPYPPAEAVALVAELARALADVHARGGFLGAVRPGAVWVTAAGLELRGAAFSGWSPWRVSLASTLGAGPHRDAALDALASAAPEQLAARDAVSARHVGAANDVYGLAALLYALLTGKTVYAGETPGAVIESVLGGSPVRPRKLAADIPRGVEEVVLHGLAKNPAHRPPSAIAFAELLGASTSRAVSPDDTSDAALLALSRASDASGVSPPPPPPPRFSMRPILVGLAVLAVVAGLTTVALLHEQRRAFDQEIQRGDELLAQGDAPGALAAFERAQAIDPPAPSLETRLARAKAEVDATKKKSEARTLLTKALTALPRSAERIHLLEAVVAADPAFLEGQRERARFLIDAVSNEPRGSDARKTDGAAAREAVHGLEKAGGTTAADAWLEAQELELERGDPSDALERAAVDTGSAEGQAAAAELALLRGQPQQAVAAIDQALADQPASARFLLVRARAYRALGDAERARTALDAALATDPKGHAVCTAALDAALEARELERAQRMLEEHSDDAEHDPDLLAARAYLAFLAGKRGPAVEEDSSRALELDPLCGRARLVRARLALVKGDVEAARHELGAPDPGGPLDALIIARALESGNVADATPERVELLLDIAQALDKANERTRARAVLDRALLLDPDDMRGRLLRGDVLFGLGSFERALVDADAIVRHQPQEIQGHALRAKVLHAAGRLEEAVQEYGTLIDMAPGQADLHAHRGLALAALHRSEEARADLEAYLASNPPAGPLVDKARSALEKAK
jgi:serine/threonine-protein kinase